MVFVEAVLFVVGLALLLQGSDFFVEAASDIATRLGVSEFFIGLTVVAIGTSIPELAASMTAAASNASALVVGSIIGSNIANIGLVVGIGAIAMAIKTDRRMLVRDGAIMLLATGLFYIVALDTRITRIEAGILLLVYFAYLLFLLNENPKTEERVSHIGSFVRYFVELRYLRDIQERAVHAFNGKKHIDRVMLRDGAILVLSLAAIIFGARAMVREAIYFATTFGVAQQLIGITVVAIGTSVPELAVTFSAARKHLGNIALGNVIGSNIANVLLVAGGAALVHPLVVSTATLAFSIPFAIFISLVLLLFLRTSWRVQRSEGVALVFVYAAFIALLVFRPALVG